jgi:hypothetical protein
LFCSGLAPAGQKGAETHQKAGMSFLVHRYCDRRVDEAIVVQLGTLLRSKRKLEELSTIIQESRRAH